ncbi:methyltransferase [Idiomarina tyrosinivorans]|uniref:Methyltransferase n=1 Tax=Idiomarina tyrosinivorans TaxID=1445662 RepID=A0A432ZSB2_9GAMM|nr:methyltransferase [Idiomarina tyrosinivorans]RUO80779.1 methyltransferase [Idiomarina tyrosinivorans]
MSFQCRQFYLKDDHCAMKVGTDSLLLGSWCGVADSGVAADLGCGCGILALMLAQRSEHLLIHGVDSCADSLTDATSNVQQSPWPHRIILRQQDIFQPLPQPCYQQVISNPPFFVDSLESPERGRRRARHASTVQLSEWLLRAYDLLDKNGLFSTILPMQSWLQLQPLVIPTLGHPVRGCEVRSVAPKPVSRVLVEWQKKDAANAAPCQFASLVIHHQGDYSAAYQQLTAPFYLRGEQW